MDDATRAVSAPPTAGTSPVRAIIHLDRLRHNVRTLRERAGGASLMGIVKADAYGHGAVRVARTLHEEGVRHFAVARVREGVALRDAGIDAPILVLGAPLPHHLAAYDAYDLGVTVAAPAVADAVIEAAAAGAVLRAHVKVDTGMGRIGLSPEEAPAIVRRLRSASGIEVAGLWTHFAAADDDPPSFAHRQLDRFEAVLQGIEEAPPGVHVANSSALLTLPDRLSALRPALARVGIMLYGLADRAALAEAAGLQPVMQLTAQVTHVKTVAPGTSISYGRQWTADRATRIATIGAGYGDGYLRLCSNRAVVGLHGHRVPVVGAVCMDMFMVDLGPPGTPPDVAVGDTAVLFGPGGPSAFEVAAWAETIPYEVCCRVDERVPRHYVDGATG